MKTSLILVALALLACLIVMGSRPDEPDEPVGASVPETSRGPSFEVRVVMPRLHLPLFGILPEPIEDLLDGLPRELGFDHASRGAEIGSVRPDRLELRADGWDLFLETDGEGGVAPGTRLVFPLFLAEDQRILRCRPADRASGYLRTTPRAGSDELGGRFLVKLATCEKAESGKTIDWPVTPLTLRGSFEGLLSGAQESSASNARASRRSPLSKPSVNQP